jgi:N-acetylmuramoyl-L-alanine amidase
MNGADPSNGALYFYNPKTTKSKWLFTLKTLKTIGNHRFAIDNKK